MTNETWVLGIDPGISGALALLQPDGKLARVWDMPGQIKVHGKGGEVNPYLLADLVEEAMDVSHGELEAAVERVASMPRQGVASTFAFGAAYGVVRGVLGGLQVPVGFVLPRAWKAPYGLLKRDKGASLGVAIEQWPGWRDSFKRKKDNGRADAALIGLYALQTYHPT